MLNFSKLKKRIKKHEGFRNRAYLDKLGNLTIGYGHLIRKSEKFRFRNKLTKRKLIKIFEKDFNIAVGDFNKRYNKLKMSKETQEVLIEMIFQLGINRLMKFKKFNNYLKKNLFYLAALEMLDSLWYLQTPKRVENLVNILLGPSRDKKR